MVERATALSVCLLVVPTLTGCREDQACQLASLSPAEVAYDVPSFKLTVYGQGFDRKSRIVFNHSALESETVFVSPGQLSVQIQLDTWNLSFGGEHVLRIPVTVRHPERGYARNELLLAVKQNPVFGETRQVPEPEPPQYAWRLPKLTLGSGGQMHIFWSQKGEIFHSTSADLGRTWNGYLRLSQRFNLKGLYDPAAAVDDAGSTVMVWVQSNDVDHPYAEPATLYFARALSGQTWEGPRTIGGSDMYIPSPRIHTGAGRIDVVYGQKKGALHRLLLLSSRDSGVTWEEGVISEETYTAFEEPIPLSLAADGASNAFVTYNHGYNTRYGYQVCYRHSPDAGRTWGEERTLIGYGGWTRGIKVDSLGSLACSGLEMYLPYSQRTIFLFSSDRGQHWQKTITAESRQISDIFFPAPGTTALVYGGQFRRLGEGGNRPYRGSAYTDRDVYDCTVVHDPPDRFYVLWQEEGSDYHVFLTPGQVYGDGS